MFSSSSRSKSQKGRPGQEKGIGSLGFALESGVKAFAAAMGEEKPKKATWTADYRHSYPPQQDPNAYAASTRVPQYGYPQGAPSTTGDPRKGAQDLEYQLESAMRKFEDAFKTKPSHHSSPPPYGGDQHGQQQQQQQKKKKDEEDWESIEDWGTLAEAGANWLKGNKNDGSAGDDGDGELIAALLGG